MHLARADKQVGTMLLLWPCCWSVVLAAPVEAWPVAVLLMGKFAVGALVMRGAGCTINDLWDKGNTWVVLVYMDMCMDAWECE